MEEDIQNYSPTVMLRETPCRFPQKPKLKKGIIYEVRYSGCASMSIDVGKDDRLLQQWTL